LGEEKKKCFPYSLHGRMKADQKQEKMETRSRGGAGKNLGLGEKHVGERGSVRRWPGAFLELARETRAQSELG